MWNEKTCFLQLKKIIQNLAKKCYFSDVTACDTILLALSWKAHSKTVLSLDLKLHISRINTAVTLCITKWCSVKSSVLLFNCLWMWDLTLTRNPQKCLYRSYSDRGEFLWLTLTSLSGLCNIMNVLDQKATAAIVAQMNPLPSAVVQRRRECWEPRITSFCRMGDSFPFCFWKVTSDLYAFRTVSMKWLLHVKWRAALWNKSRQTAHGYHFEKERYKKGIYWCWQQVPQGLVKLKVGCLFGLWREHLYEGQAFLGKNTAERNYVSYCSSHCLKMAVKSKWKWWLCGV